MSVSERRKMGVHILIDIWECEKGDASILNNFELIEKILEDAAKTSGMCIFGKLKKKFKPNGVSLIFGIMESHFTIHTWPDEGYAAIDIFTCGNEGNADVAAEFVTKMLKKYSPGRELDIIIQKIGRGV